MLGRPWYEDGKKLTKQNTFNDFIDVTKGLVEQGYGAKDQVFAVGGSAGGLLMGAIINQALSCIAVLAHMFHLLMLLQRCLMNRFHSPLMSMMNGVTRTTKHTMTTC